MRQTRDLFSLLMIFVLSALGFSSQAQSHKTERKKEFYFSWGYNTEWYTKSNVKIKQPSMGNDYVFMGIKGHDNPGWNKDLFSKALTIPQYSYRIGLFINKHKGLAVEINFDHTKFIFADQQARIKGTINNKPVDSSVNFNMANGYYYYLNNGANFLLFNIVKRWNWIANKKETIKIDILGKAGVGPVIPHVENSLNYQLNNPGFQLGGWNIGVEAALRTTFFNYVFLEYSNKLDYARYANLDIYKGKASHAFGTYEMMLNLGVSFPVGGKIK